jgi:cobalt-zinc-cadmium efflux system outer membrane protein
MSRSHAPSRQAPLAAEVITRRPTSRPGLLLRAWSAALLLAVSWPAVAEVDSTTPGATLESLLTLARERHPELRVMQLEAEAAAQRVAPAGALPDPMLGIELRDATNEMTGGNLSLLPGRVGSTRYQLRQSFPAWGQRDARRAAAQAGADEASLRIGATWADLALRVKTAYARWQQVHATLAQLHEILALTNRFEAVAQARYASGLAPQQDAIRAQVERTGVATEIALLEAEQASLRVRINGLLARPLQAALAPPQGDAPPPVPARLDATALRERVLARNPQLAVEEARVRAAQKNKDVVWSNRYPTFTVGVAPIQTRKRISEWELMFEINIPLQQATRRADESQAQAMLAAAQARKETAANELLALLGEQIAALEAARQVESITQTSLLPQASLTLQAALAGYETGKLDFATVLEAQRQVRSAQLNLIRTRAEARMRLAEIERLLGEEP